MYSEALGSKRVGGRVGVIRFSGQICTDLKNGPDEFQKAWKTEKPERGWPLCPQDICELFQQICLAKPSVSPGIQ